MGPAAQVRIPADARVFDLAGRVVHAAYLDPYVTADRLAGKKPKGPQDDEEPAEPGVSGRGSGGPPASNRAADRVVGSLPVKDRVAESYRRLGFAVVAVAPPSPGVLRGAARSSALGDGPVESRLLSSDFGQYVSLEPERLRDFSEFTRLSYPASKMGAVALVRQSFLDALWLRDAQAAYAKRPVGQARPTADAAAAALVPAAEGKQPVVFEAADVLALLRAGRIAREMKLRAEYVGAGDEYRFRAEVAAAKPDLILRVDFPRPYKYDTEEEWDAVPIETLRRIRPLALEPEVAPRRRRLLLDHDARARRAGGPAEARPRSDVARALFRRRPRVADDHPGAAARALRPARSDRSGQDREPRRRDGRAVRRGRPSRGDLDRREAIRAAGEIGRRQG